MEYCREAPRLAPSRSPAGIPCKRRQKRLLHSRAVQLRSHSPFHVMRVDVREVAAETLFLNQSGFPGDSEAEQTRTWDTCPPCVRAFKRRSLFEAVSAFPLLLFERFGQSFSICKE